jgi:hypothetical protein
LVFRQAGSRIGKVEQNRQDPLVLLPDRRADDPVQRAAVRAERGDGSPGQADDMDQVGLVAERVRQPALADGCEELRRHGTSVSPVTSTSAR